MSAMEVFRCCNEPLAKRHMKFPLNEPLAGLKKVIGLRTQL